MTGFTRVVLLVMQELSSQDYKWILCLQHDTLWDLFPQDIEVDQDIELWKWCSVIEYKPLQYILQSK